jgi:hypothetical protein
MAWRSPWPRPAIWITLSPAATAAKWCLRVPLVTAHIWLVANQNYYVAHREQVEALWNWMATHQGELGALLGKYSRK